MTYIREATLEELLSEPIIRKVMARDGVRVDDIRSLMKQASIRMACKRELYRPCGASVSAPCL